MFQGEEARFVGFAVPQTRGGKRAGNALLSLAQVRLAGLLTRPQHMHNQGVPSKMKQHACQATASINSTGLGAYLCLNLLAVGILEVQPATKVMQPVGSQTQHLAQEVLQYVPPRLV